MHETVSLEAAPRPSAAAPAGDDADLSPEDFQKLQMEVEKFGESQGSSNTHYRYYTARWPTRLPSNTGTATINNQNMSPMTASSGIDPSDRRMTH